MISVVVRYYLSTCDWDHTHYSVKSLAARYISGGKVECKWSDFPLNVSVYHCFRVMVAFLTGESLSNSQRFFLPNHVPFEPFSYRGWVSAPESVYAVLDNTWQIYAVYEQDRRLLCMLIAIVLCETLTTLVLVGVGTVHGMLDWTMNVQSRSQSEG